MKFNQFDRIKEYFVVYIVLSFVLVYKDDFYKYICLGAPRWVDHPYNIYSPAKWRLRGWKFKRKN